ncbi:MAG: LacI family transcriptional regulator [Clostridiales bacterium]|jgi:LacI family transcriptional regulator|nr:LacI family transcriptional regulator [Clostridiales bacterium]
MPNSTIYSIAQKVGLSPSTVARALRSDGVCSEKNRKLILETAKSMGYAPSASARSLRSRKTHNIMFCIPDLYNDFYFGMISGAAEVLEQNGYFAIVCHTASSLKKELMMIDNLRARVGDGMIIVSFDFTKPLVDAMNSCGMPIVTTNIVENPPERLNFDTVYIETTEGIYIAARHLIAQGHEKIGYIGGDVRTYSARQRLNGYLKAIGEAGIARREDYEANGGFTRDGGFVCGARLVSLSDRPTAIVAANDLMALGALEACKAQGLRMPADVALVGMDDTLITRVTNPAITSVRMRQDDIGHIAAELLVQRIKNPDKERSVIMLTPDIVIRESSIMAGGNL